MHVFPLIFTFRSIGCVRVDDGGEHSHDGRVGHYRARDNLGKKQVLERRKNCFFIADLMTF